MKKSMTFLSIIFVSSASFADIIVVKNLPGGAYETIDHLFANGCIKDVEFLKGVPSKANKGGINPLSKVNLTNCKDGDSLEDTTIIFTGTDVMNGLSLSSSTGKRIHLTTDQGGIVIFRVK